MCLVYNIVKYAVDYKNEMVVLMDNLEREAATLQPGQYPESLLDAGVPQPGDSAKIQEARQLLAMRYLLQREAECLPCTAKHTGRKDRPGSASPPRAAPLQTAKWPVSGTCRPFRARRQSPSATFTLHVPDSRTNNGTDVFHSHRQRSPTNRLRVSPNKSDLEPTNASFIPASGRRARRSLDSSSSPSIKRTPRPKRSISRRLETPASTTLPFSAKMSPLAAEMLEKRHPTNIATGDGNVHKECSQRSQSTQERLITKITSPRPRANMRDRTSSSSRSPSTARRPTPVSGSTTWALKRPSHPGSASAASRKKVNRSRDDACTPKTLDGRALRSACLENMETEESETIGIPSCNESAPEAGDSTGSGNLSGMNSPLHSSSPERRQTLTEKRYPAWKDNDLSKLLKEGGSYKSTFDTKHPRRESISQRRLKPKSHERHPSEMRGSRDAADEGEQIQKLVRHPEPHETRSHHTSEREHDQHFRRRSERTSERHTKHKSDRRPKHQPEKHSEFSMDKHPQSVTEKEFDSCYEKNLEPPVEKHLDLRTEESFEPQAIKHSEPHSEKHLKPFSEKHFEPPTEEHFRRRAEPPIEEHQRRRPEPPILEHFQRRPELPIDVYGECRSDSRAEKYSRHRAGKYTDHRTTKYASHRADKYSRHPVDQHPEIETKQSDQQMKKDNESPNAEGYSENKEKRWERSERHHAHQVEKDLYKKFESHCDHRPEEAPNRSLFEEHSERPRETFAESRFGRNAQQRDEKEDHRMGESDRSDGIQERRHFEKSSEPTSKDKKKVFGAAAEIISLGGFLGLRNFLPPRTRSPSPVPFPEGGDFSPCESPQRVDARNCNYPDQLNSELLGSPCDRTRPHDRCSNLLQPHVGHRRSFQTRTKRDRRHV